VIRHAQGGGFGISFLDGIDNFFMLIVRRFDAAQGTKCMTPIDACARANAQYLLTQKRVSRAFINDFMELQVGFLPTVHVFFVGNFFAAAMQFHQSLDVVVGHAFTGQSHGNALKLSKQFPQGKQLLQIHFGHHRSTPWGAYQNTLRLKLKQGFSNWRARNFVMVCQGHIVYGITRQQLA
jgi:hypothetical protein